MAPLTVTSSAFQDGQPIPVAFTCRGAGDVPPLSWSGVPRGTTSLAVVVRDPDAPRGTFVHWIVYGIPTTVSELRGVPSGAAEGPNSGGGRGWYPPCPPRGTHRYRFTVYALGSPVQPGTEPLLAQIERNAVASGTLTGTVSAR